MRIKGFLAILILGMVFVYLLFMVKGKETEQIKESVEAFGRAKDKLTRTNMISLTHSIDAYIANWGEAPASLNDIRSTNPLTLGKEDAWGTKLKYERLSAEKIRLTSAGKDKTFGTEDDIVVEN